MADQGLCVFFCFGFVLQDNVRGWNRKSQGSFLESKGRRWLELGSSALELDLLVIGLGRSAMELGHLASDLGYSSMQLDHLERDYIARHFF